MDNKGRSGPCQAGPEPSLFITNHETGDIMFSSSGAGPRRNVLSGIDMTPLAWGERTMLVRFDLQQGSTIPSHRHPHEQTGLLLSGRLRLTIGDQTVEAAAGAAWSIPSDVPHAAEALSDCVAVEVFAPVREDYLP
jgi:quercetin dioxygenase-like cupin family protein